MDDTPQGLAGDVSDEFDSCHDPNNPPLDATFSDVVTPGCEGAYVITRTWSLSDDCDNPAEDQVQIITVVDEIVPTFTAPADITLFKDADCLVDESPNGDAGDVIDEADNCTTVLNATFSDTIEPICPGSYTITRTWSLVDDCDNAAADQVQIITVLDNTPPSATAADCDFETEILTSSCDAPLTSAPVFGGYALLGEYEDHYYYLSDGALNWEDAALSADVLGGYLAAINSADENTALNAWLVSSGIYTTGGQYQVSPYLGLVDINSENEYFWYNGENLDYTNWAANEPNDFQNLEDCVQMLPNGQWNDIFDEGRVLRYVLEVPKDDCCPGSAFTNLHSGQALSTDAQWQVAGNTFGFTCPITDNCSEVTVNVVSVEYTGDDCARTITVTFNAEDDCHNISEVFTHAYTIKDDTAPIFTAPADITLYKDEACLVDDSPRTCR